MYYKAWRVSAPVEVYGDNSQHRRIQR
jgi:hypothetical protein